MEGRKPRTPRAREKVYGFTKIHLSVIKLLFMLLGAILVLVFQSGRAQVPDIYYTNKPLDHTRGGNQYTCGCSLPAFLQTANNPPDKRTNSTWNICYEGSSLETVNILVYPNFTGVKDLEKVLHEADPEEFRKSRNKRTVSDGFNATMHAHDLAWGTDAIFDSYTEQITDLYLGGFRQQDSYVKVSDLVDGSEFRDFPASQLAMTVGYHCSNCSTCGLSKVNDILTKIAGNSSRKALWGQCINWGSDNHCYDEDSSSYQAKCVMYPGIAPVPLVFGIQRFFQNLSHMEGVYNITPPRNRTVTGFASLAPNEVYLNISSVVSSNVELNFWEMRKGSSAWLPLLQKYPALDRNCSGLEMATVCNGTSVCNMYKGSETDEVQQMCRDMKDEVRCQKMHSGVTVDDVPESLWREYNLPHGYWQNLTCLPYHCTEKPPFLVLRQTAPIMQNSSLNKFLESKILSKSWAQNSGVCTQTYKNVYRYLPKKERKSQTRFMEANCSRGPGMGYCWPTGQYHNFTDSPGEAWKEMNDNQSSGTDRFVCYRVYKEGWGTWFIVTFGILFGWLGTIDLIFKWIERFLLRSKQKEQSPAEKSKGADPEADSGGMSLRSVREQRSLEEPEAASQGTQLHGVQNDSRSPLEKHTSPILRTRTRTREHRTSDTPKRGSRLENLSPQDQPSTQL